MPIPGNADVDAAIIRLTGTIEQQPPDYSAKLSGGIRAYDAARKGTPLALEPTRVTVHRWTILSRDEKSVTARIECSGGTYIRALARDLGRAAGSAAHLESLRRIAMGSLHVRDAPVVPSNADVRSAFGTSALIRRHRGKRGDAATCDH